MTRLGLVLDFDRTITETDIGDEVIRRYAKPGWREAIARYRDGRFNVRELQEWEVSHLPVDQRDAMIDFAVNSARIRPGLNDLLAHCSAAGIPVEVASNGLDFCINAIFAANGLQDLAVASPSTVFDNGPCARIKFADRNRSCDRTGLCKCERIWRMRRSGRAAVYVGDGISDHCVVHQADFVMARDGLNVYCRDRKIPFTPFEDFRDVLAEIHRISPQGQP